MKLDEDQKSPNAEHSLEIKTFFSVFILILSYSWFSKTWNASHNIVKLGEEKNFYFVGM